MYLEIILAVVTGRGFTLLIFCAVTAIVATLATVGVAWWRTLLPEEFDAKILWKDGGFFLMSGAIAQVVGLVVLNLDLINPVYGNITALLVGVTVFSCAVVLRVYLARP